MAVRKRKKSFAARLAPLQPLGPRKPDTSALEAIWHVVSAIPRGQVSTYGAVARAAGLPGRARLTGFALKVAPGEMNVPWHRVVGAGGRISFPPSSSGYREQVRRLKADGVTVRQGRVEPAAMTTLDEP